MIPELLAIPRSMDKLVSLLIGNPRIENVFIRYLCLYSALKVLLCTNILLQEMAADHQDCLLPGGTVSTLATLNNHLRNELRYCVSEISVLGRLSRRILMNPGQLELHDTLLLDTPPHPHSEITDFSV